jgi:hypothetical protein
MLKTIGLGLVAAIILVATLAIAARRYEDAALIAAMAGEILDTIPIETEIAASAVTHDAATGNRTVCLALRSTFGKGYSTRRALAFVPKQGQGRWFLDNGAADDASRAEFARKFRDLCGEHNLPRTAIRL